MIKVDPLAKRAFQSSQNDSKNVERVAAHFGRLAIFRGASTSGFAYTHLVNA
jgi:hypothetical protein